MPPEGGWAPVAGWSLVSIGVTVGAALFGTWLIEPWVCSFVGITRTRADPWSQYSKRASVHGPHSTPVRQHRGHTVRPLAFVLGVCILLVGVGGIIAPSGLVWIARHFTTSGAFYGIAIVRVAFGVILISAAAASRAPKFLRVVGYIIVVAGIATALVGLIDIGSALAMIDWWRQQGAAVIRLTGIPIAVLGSFVAYTCAPVRRAA